MRMRRDEIGERMGGAPAWRGAAALLAIGIVVPLLLADATNCFEYEPAMTCDGVTIPSGVDHPLCPTRITLNGDCPDVSATTGDDPGRTDWTEESRYCEWQRYKLDPGSGGCVVDGVPETYEKQCMKLSSKPCGTYPVGPPSAWP